MDVLEALERLRETEWIDEEGESIDVQMASGFSTDEINRFERSLGAPLPNDYRVFAENCSAIESGSIEVDLRFATHEFWIEELIPFGVPFAHDGCGNYWVIDPLPNREARAFVFYVCHDPPVLLKQGVGIAQFLEALPAYDRGEEDSPIRKVWSTASFKVWNEDPCLIPCEEALSSSDPMVRAFAEEIGEPCHIVDLRDVPDGAGFTWGRYGMNTRRRRFGDERIFAIAMPHDER